MWLYIAIALLTALLTAAAIDRYFRRLERMARTRRR